LKSTWPSALLVIRDLPPAVSVDRPFSCRYQLPDQWYDLHNPELTATPMTVRFGTLREDFPPHLEELTIQHVALYFARTNGASFKIELDRLLYTADGASGSLGGGALSIDGIVSSRRNAPSWIPFARKSSVRRMGARATNHRSDEEPFQERRD